MPVIFGILMVVAQLILIALWQADVRLTRRRYEAEIAAYKDYVARTQRAEYVANVEPVDVDDDMVLVDNFNTRTYVTAEELREFMTKDVREQEGDAS